MKKFLLSIGLLAACGVVSAQTVITQTPKTEPTAYPEVVLAGSETKASLTNNWLYTVTEGFDNFFGFAAGNARNMAVANGKVYIAERNTKEEADKTISGSVFLHVFNAETGAFIKSVNVPKVFRTATDETRFINNFPATTLTTDSQGRLVLANLATDIQNGLLEVWVLNDEDDQNPVKLLSVTGKIGLPEAPAPRVDYVNVVGDLKSGKAYVFAALAGNTFIIRWEIVDGTFTFDGDEVSIPTPGFDSNPFATPIQEKQYFPTAAVSFGTAPFVLPVSKDLVYVDGHTTIPTLYRMADGTYVDGFYDAGTKAVFGTVPNTGANGLAELTLGDHSFIVAGKNNHGPAAMNERNVFVLYAKSGEDISEGISEVYSQFPLVGMGKTGVTNSSYVVLPKVNIIDDKTAEIYIFAQDNGFGKYTLKLLSGSGIIEGDADAITVSYDGTSFVASEEVASLEVYTIAGQKIAADASVASGVYIAKTVNTSGVAATHKVLVK